MTDTPRITIGSAAATALQSSIQANLALRSWADKDDAVMAEYVLVMLANSKSAVQINAELADLIGTDYNDDFTAWLWPEAQRITNAMRGKASPPAPMASPTHDRERRRSRSPASRDRDRVRAREEDTRERRGPDAGVAQRWQQQPQQDPRGNARWEEDERGPRIHQGRQARPLFNSAFDAATGGARGRTTLSGRTNGSAPRNGGGDAAMHAGAPSPAQRSAGRTMMDDPAYAGYQAVPQPSGDDDDVFAAGLSSGVGAGTGGFEAPPTGPRAMRIKGAGANAASGGLFARTMALQQAPHQQQQQQQQQANSTSILSRLSVPDPRAGAFEPSSSNPDTSETAAGSSLLSRLDPMVPLNAPLLPPAPTAPVPASHTTPWPKQPTDTGLCRYGSHCTNPLCGFSHPSPSFAKARVEREEAGGDTAMGDQGNAGAGEEDPLVLDSTACLFGTGCTRIDCARSHTSPAQMFLLEKGVLPPSTEVQLQVMPSSLDFALGAAPVIGVTRGSTLSSPQASKVVSVPCKFQQSCTNATCSFYHFKPKSSAVFSPPRSSHAFSPTRSATTTTVACKFGSACTRANCTFTHPAGRAMDIGARPEADAKHVSNRLARFANAGTAQAGGAQDKVEQILPGQTTDVDAGLAIVGGEATKQAEGDDDVPV